MEDIPQKYICCLTLEVMAHPVQHKVSKHNFERSAIMEWIYFGKATCPLTREQLHPKDFVDNVQLKEEIENWKRENDIMDESWGMDDSSTSIQAIRKMPTRRNDITQRQGSVKDLMSIRNRVLEKRDKMCRNARRHTTGAMDLPGLSSQSDHGYPTPW